RVQVQAAAAPPAVRGLRAREPGTPWGEGTGRARGDHGGAMTKSVRLGRLRFGGGAPLFLIRGPCVIGSPPPPGKVAPRLKELTGELGIPLIFKASYDKANRSSLGSYRGMGLERGLEILAGVKARHGVPILTDVHAVSEVERVAQVADVIQIPAFLC